MEYEPFGQEWVQEMQALPKDFLIKLLPFKEIDFKKIRNKADLVTELRRQLMIVKKFTQN